MLMLRTLFVLSLCCLALPSEAHQPVFPDPTGSSDYVVISEPTVSHAYYGSLSGFPHTYQIVVEDEPIAFFAEVLVPDIASAKNNRSVIVVKEETRGVSEVTRLRAKEADWNSFYEPFGADMYRQGSSYSGELTPGTYLVEVSTPDNDGKYVLSIGTKEQFSLINYFGTVRDIYHVKQFFGKSGVAVVQSPLVYGPLLVIFSFFVYWYIRKRQHA